MIVNIGFSGGRTSAYLTENALKYHPENKYIVTFANTGMEHKKTLEFVNNCDKHWQKQYGVGVVWLEAVVHDSRKPCSHKVVTFETASRNGEPLRAIFKKYGLPNGNFLHCTREAKENPILSYMQSLGEKPGHTKNKQFISATYETWIGIRADEPKRLGGRMDGKQLKRHPLADGELACDKQDVLDFWEGMPFDLDIPEHLGNCIDCHKKSKNKLFKVARDMGEEAFSFSIEMDEKYSSVGAQILPNGELMKRKRYRGYTNTSELIAMFKDSDFNPKNYNDESGGCSEECQPFAMNNEP